MSYYLSVNELHIPYEIERTRRRTYGITMKPGGDVIVRIPMRGSISYARTMIEDKKRLGLQKLYPLKGCRTADPAKG